MFKSARIVTLILTLSVIFVACGLSPTKNKKSEVSIFEPDVTISSTATNLSCYTDEQTIETEPFLEEEITAITKTLAGECFDDKINDKRLVVEVILNRVSNGGFGESVLDVVSAKNQFEGYWKQSRPISDSDIQIAEDTLREWYNNDCKKLSEYLFFCAGPNRENSFRVDY